MAGTVCAGQLILQIFCAILMLASPGKHTDFLNWLLKTQAWSRDTFKGHLIREIEWRLVGLLFVATGIHFARIAFVTLRDMRR